MSPAAADQPDPAGRDINLTWWYTFLSVAGVAVFLLAISALITVSMMHRFDAPVWLLVTTLGLFVCTAVANVYLSWLIRDGYGAGWPQPRIMAAALVPPLACWMLTAFAPGAVLYGAIPLWVTLSTLLPLIPRAHRWPVTLAGLASIVLHGALNPQMQPVSEGGFVFGIILLILMTPSSFLFTGWLWNLIIRLDDARTVNSQLAVARERLRFASDLHDIQGHHLQVIALKAELAQRLMPSDTAEHRKVALEAIGEIRELAEQAQAETRELVRDLRVVSLAEELDNAKGVLEAADITTEVSVSPEVQTSASGQNNRLLGFAVREATTNILRHANATQVHIHLHCDDDELRLRIRNDGVTPAAAPTQGTGLDGLRQRFQAVGGSIATSQEAATFELDATLPCPDQEVQS